MAGDLRRSPLHDWHVAAHAKLVGFGGFEMPLAYPTGTVAEHLACRQGAACFDVSHLGTVEMTGDDAFERLQGQLSNDLRRIGPGRAQYSHLLDEDGSVLDDVIVWWVDDTTFDVMPNATNTSRVRNAIGGRDTTAQRAVVAVQGPTARAVVGAIWPEAAAVGRFMVAPVAWRGTACMVAGTGYTGEDGVELAVPVQVAAAIWQALVDAGAVPAGLGARDTLRLEAGLPLFGHELGPGITPLQAGLGWVVGWDKPLLRAREALAAERERGPARRLRGIVASGRRPLRDGATVLFDGRAVGRCTSGSFSPVLGRGIALCLLDAGPGGEALPEGTEVAVDLRGAHVPATVVAPPFVPLPSPAPIAGR
ncbi:MAG: glycine cleavage system aminomethyltransferase GcvT [Actinomycetota bacterium]|jgi:aminomethyltransferase|nr:glycine cleavage system aminomethyltransferase GcvT [Actinomycetota bacterium]